MNKSNKDETITQGNPETMDKPYYPDYATWLNEAKKNKKEGQK